MMHFQLIKENNRELYAVCFRRDAKLVSSSLSSFLVSRMNELMN